MPSLTERDARARHIRRTDMVANERTEPAVIAAVERARTACVDRGLIAGIFCSNVPAAAKRAAERFDLVTRCNDTARRS